MKIKESAGYRIFSSFNVLFMLVLTFVTIYPVLHVLFASFSNGNELLAHSGILLWPIKFSISAYFNVFRDPMIVNGYANTLFILVVGVSINVLLTCLGAYFFSREGVMWKTPLFLFVLFTMFFNGGVIPFYLTVQGIRMDDSIWALIIPSAINTFNLIILRTGFRSVPISLEESARLDGAGHLRIMFQIILPLCMPIIAVILLYYAVEKWNSWFHAMMFIKTRSKSPLQLVLRGILLSNDNTAMTTGTSAADQEGVGEAVKYAVIVVATAPILILYPFLQKYFVKGVLVGAVKG